ncbi:unnamed protein product [Acanthoscelides obtectus]|nr:unnamed protein product [Acanthoscelides obtectus]CAK1663156.1 hypothetical protein AOBTE_LOCUS23518 [Acanthoscelides obtectus]
MLILIDV